MYLTHRKSELRFRIAVPIELQPGAQTVVNGGFTMSVMSLNILEHLDEKPPEGANPLIAVFLWSIVGALRSSCLSAEPLSLSPKL
jgi:hypothetical protein